MSYRHIVASHTLLEAHCAIAAPATVVSSTSLPQVMIAKPSSVVQLPTAATTTASGGIKPVVRVSPMATGGIATAAASSVTQTAVRGENLHDIILNLENVLLLYRIILLILHFHEHTNTLIAISAKLA